MSVNRNFEHNNATSKEHRLAQLKPIIVDSLAKAFSQNKEVTNNLEAIFDLLAGKAPFAPDVGACKLGSGFLNEATRDIKSYKLLYSKKLYPHAIYHLQQAIEKSIKGYVLIEGYFKITELREIKTHQSPLVLMKAVLERTGIRKLAEISNDRTLKNKIGDAKAAMANEGKRIEIAKTSKAEIKGLFSRIEDYQKTTNLIKQGLTNGLTKIGFDPIPTSAFQNLSALITIMILAIITFPHESYTRYPDGKMTPNDYTNNLGIVKEAPNIAHILEVEIRNLEKIYEEKE